MNKIVTILITFYKFDNKDVTGFTYQLNNNKKNDNKI